MTDAQDAALADERVARALVDENADWLVPEYRLRILAERCQRAAGHEDLAVRG